MLALIPVRRAISFVPSSTWPAASASRTATARSTAATWRTAGFPVRVMVRFRLPHFGYTIAEEAITCRLPSSSPTSSSAPESTASRPPITSPRSFGRAGSAPEADIVVLEKTGPGAGASGIACGVVRNNYFQPAMSELMQACVEVWESDPEAYAYNAGRLHRARARGAGVGPRSDLRAPGADRLPLEAHRRARREVDALHEGALPGLARQGRDGLPARAPGRLCLQQGLGPGPRSASARREGVEHPHRRRGDRLRDRVATTRSRAVETNQGRIEVGEQVVIAPGPWAKQFWAHARAAGQDRRADAGRRRRARTGRCGPTGTSRRARSPSTRRCSRPPTAALRP